MTTKQDAIRVYGTALTKALQTVYGSDAGPRFQRLMNHRLPPLPPHVPAPVRVNQSQVAMMKMAFAKQAEAHAAKATQLCSVLRDRCKHLTGVGFKGTLKHDDGKTETALVDVAELTFNGLTLATVGSWIRPCLQGLKRLESILVAVPHFPGPDRDLIVAAVAKADSSDNDAVDAQADSSGYDHASDDYDAACDQVSADFNVERDSAQEAYDRESEAINALNKGQRKKIEADERAGRSSYGEYSAAMAALSDHYDVADKGCRDRLKAAIKAANDRYDARLAAAKTLLDAQHAAIDRGEAPPTAENCPGVFVVNDDDTITCEGKTYSIEEFTFEESRT